MSYLKKVQIYHSNVCNHVDVVSHSTSHCPGILQNENELYFFSNNLYNNYRDLLILHFRILKFFHPYKFVFLSNFISIYIYYDPYFYV